MDIMSLVAGSVTPMMASKVASTLDLSEPTVRKVILLAMPVILAMVMRRGTTQRGLEAIDAVLGSLSVTMPGGVAPVPTGDAAEVSTAARRGSDLLGALLGVGAPGGLAKALSSHASIRENAAAALVGLAGMATLGTLRTAADRQGLDSAGVMSLLESQKDQIESDVPEDLGTLLGTAGLLPQAACAARAALPSAFSAASLSGWKKWVFALAAVSMVEWWESPFFGGRPLPGAATGSAPASAAPARLRVATVVTVADAVHGALT